MHLYNSKRIMCFNTTIFLLLNDLRLVSSCVFLLFFMTKDLRQSNIRKGRRIVIIGKYHEYSQVGWKWASIQTIFDLSKWHYPVSFWQVSSHLIRSRCSLDIRKISYFLLDNVVSISYINLSICCLSALKTKTWQLKLISLMLIFLYQKRKT